MHKNCSGLCTYILAQSLFLFFLSRWLKMPGSICLDFCGFKWKKIVFISTIYLKCHWLRWREAVRVLPVSPLFALNLDEAWWSWTAVARGTQVWIFTSPKKSNLQSLPVTSTSFYKDLDLQAKTADINSSAMNLPLILSTCCSAWEIQKGIFFP